VIPSPTGIEKNRKGGHLAPDQTFSEKRCGGGRKKKGEEGSALLAPAVVVEKRGRHLRRGRGDQ